MKKLLKEKETCEQIYCEKNARPSWISNDLMIQTKRVWQKYYETPLTESEIIEIITGVSWIFN